MVARKCLRRGTNRIRQSLLAGLIASALICVPASAGTIVEVQTVLGSFYLELNDEAAPQTVANFLSYVNTDRYNSTIIHNVQAGGQIMGGGYGYNSCDQGPIPIQTDPPIPFESTGLSNLSGTIAMLHFADDINSAASQWYINLGNAPDLDSLNGGYAVFGEVIGDGLSVIGNIAQLPTSIVTPFVDVPVIDYLGFTANCANFTRDNLVQLVMSVVARDNGEATSRFDNASGMLSVDIDAGALGFLNLSFTIYESEPQVVIQAQLESAVELPTPVPSMARFNVFNGELHLPELAVDGTVLFRNVVFTLTDEDSALFTLTAFE